MGGATKAGGGAGATWGDPEIGELMAEVGGVEKVDVDVAPGTSPTVAAAVRLFTKLMKAVSDVVPDGLTRVKADCCEAMAAGGSASDAAANRGGSGDDRRRGSGDDRRGGTWRARELRRSGPPFCAVWGGSDTGQAMRGIAGRVDGG